MPILASAIGWTGWFLMRLRGFALTGTMSAIVLMSGFGAFALFEPEKAFPGEASGSGGFPRAVASVIDNDTQLDGFIQVVALSNWEGATTVPPADEVDPKPLLLAAYTPPVDYADESSVVVETGDNLFGVLTRAGVLTGQAEMVIQSLGELYDPRRDLRAGQELALIFDQHVELTAAEGSGRHLASLILPVSFDRHVIVSRSGDDYEAEEVVRELESKFDRGSGTIETSLFQDGGDVGIPHQVLADLIQLYSFDVDFQRELRQGDTFEVMYVTLFDAETGEEIQYGDITYAMLTVNGTQLPLYRFETSDGDVDYYDRDGQSVRRALMRTPIEGARVSSGFGNRRHPVLGYNRMHTGTDFAAPRGTPIYAAGDGVIESIGNNGGYGKYIRVRHNSTYKTAYAHMSRFATGLRRGMRVTQGQIIGFVGSTGRSTGPHLHYEVVRDGDKINPLSLDLPRGTALSGDERIAFFQFRDDLDRRYGLKAAETLVAEAPDDEDESQLSE